MVGPQIIGSIPDNLLNLTNADYPLDRTRRIYDDVRDLPREAIAAEFHPLHAVLDEFHIRRMDGQQNYISAWST